MSSTKKLTVVMPVVRWKPTEVMYRRVRLKGTHRFSAASKKKRSMRPLFKYAVNRLTLALRFGAMVDVRL
jgi:hypothetical protein